MSALERAIAHPDPVRGFARRSPLHGLDRRSIGFVEALAQSVSAVAPAAAATTMPLLVASIAGAASVVSIVTAGLLALLVAASVNQFTRRIAATGSLYTFVALGLGRVGTRAALVTGSAMLAGYGFVSMFALAGGGYYLTILAGRLWPAAAGSVWLPAGIIVTLAVIVGVVLGRGIRHSARVTLVIEFASVAILLGLVIALLVRIGPHVDWSVLTREAFGAGSSPPGFAVGAVIALGAFIGFESSASLAVEVRRPFAAIPRALVWTVLGAGLFYVLAATGQVAGFDVLGEPFDGSTSPVNELTMAFGLGGVGLILDVGIAASFLACATASTTALVRVLFSMARDGLIPARFGTTHPVRRTPAFSVAVTVPIIASVPVAFTLAGAGLWHTMQVLIVTAVAGYITAYALVCVAVPVFLHRIGESTIRAVMVAAAAAVALTGALSTYLIVESSSDRAVGVWIFVGFMTLATAAQLLRMRGRPWVAGRLGSYDEPTAVDVLGGVSGGPHD